VGSRRVFGLYNRCLRRREAGLSQGADACLGYPATTFGV